jgi:hypothetical protein
MTRPEEVVVVVLVAAATAARLVYMAPMAVQRKRH